MQVSLSGTADVKKLPFILSDEQDNNVNAAKSGILVNSITISVILRQKK